MTKQAGQASPETVDLASLNLSVHAAKPFKLELRHPVTKGGLGQYILLLGMDSPQVQEFANEQANEKMRKLADRARRGLEPEVQTVEQRREEGTQLLVAATVGFENIDFGGPVTFSHAAAHKLYTELSWVRSQVDAAVADIENFMPA